MEEHCYIILYDLVAPNRDYNGLYDAIKKYTFWGRLTESAWAITTNKSTVVIRDELLQYIDKDDRLIVIQSGRNAAWSKVLASDNWVKQNIIK